MPLKFRIRFFSFPRCDAGCHFYLNTLWVKPTHLLAVFRNMCLSDSETKKKNCSVVKTNHFDTLHRTYQLYVDKMCILFTILPVRFGKNALT